VIHQVCTEVRHAAGKPACRTHVTFDLQPEAIAWLSDKGYDEKMGARPLARVIQEHIKKPLAAEILFGKLKKGGVVKVTVGNQAGMAPRGPTLTTCRRTARIKPKAEVVTPGKEGVEGCKAGRNWKASALSPRRPPSRRRQPRPPRLTNGERQSGRAARKGKHGTQGAAQEVMYPE